MNHNKQTPDLSNLTSFKEMRSLLINNPYLELLVFSEGFMLFSKRIQHQITVFTRRHGNGGNQCFKERHNDVCQI